MCGDAAAIHKRLHEQVRERVGRLQVPCTRWAMSRRGGGALVQHSGHGFLKGKYRTSAIRSLRLAERISHRREPCAQRSKAVSVHTANDATIRSIDVRQI